VKERTLSSTGCEDVAGQRFDEYLVEKVGNFRADEAFMADGEETRYQSAESLRTLVVVRNL
jgi:hypothetical protein